MSGEFDGRSTILEWAELELFRHQFGEYPMPDRHDLAKLDYPQALNKMAENCLSEDLDPFTVRMILKACALKIIELREELQNGT